MEERSRERESSSQEEGDSMTPSSTASDTIESGGDLPGKDVAMSLHIYDRGPELRL